MKYTADKSLLDHEMADCPEEWSVAIAVSGPKNMADEVRKLACEIARTRRKGVTTLVDECFGW